MFRVILLFIAFWLLYKFIFDLVIPIYRSTRVMKAKFRDMHQRMQDHMNQQSNQTQFPDNSQSQKNSTDNKEGEYIEFEDVK